MELLAPCRIKINAMYRLESRFYKLIFCEFTIEMPRTSFYHYQRILFPFILVLTSGNKMDNW